MNKNVQTFIGCDAEYAEADIVLCGIPFDGTTSYRPGARFGPSAMRAESYGIETYSPYVDRDLQDVPVFDAGDLELPFGDTKKALTMTEERVAAFLADGKTPFLLGGEHLITLGAVRAVARKHPALHILHLDAHADLRADYLGEPLSHASVMRRIWDIVGDGRIHQFGIRSGERAEFAFAAKHTHMRRYDLTGFADTVAALKNEPVYVTVDLDVLDPAGFCGTGTPEAGGVPFTALLAAVHSLSTCNLVGCDVVELSPHYDMSGASTAAACKLTREIILQIKGA
jgi:agmatinase